MSPHELESALCAQVSESVYLAPDSEGVYYVITSFTFGDGDGPVIALRENRTGWTLTDQGNTMMRLSYRLSDKELEDPELGRKMKGAMNMGSVVESEGELIRLVKGTNYAEALFDFVHTLLRIDELGYPNPSYSPASSVARSQSDVAQASMRRHSMSVQEFRESFTDLVMESLPEERINFGWYDPSWDWNGEYAVDCMVNGMATPLFLHALSTNDHAKDTIITIYRFQEQLVRGHHIAIFRDASRLTKRVRSKLDAVCETRFDNFMEERSRIKEFLLAELRR